MSVYKRVVPLGDRLMILPINESEKKNGIIIPPIKNPESQTPIKSGVVIAKSRSIKEVNQGDVVLFESTAGFELQISGIEATYRMVRMVNVMAEI